MDFSDIYNEYFRDVFHFVLSLSRDGNIAEEITQETFMRALRQLDSYDGVRDHHAWLFTIARNAWYDHCRRRRYVAPMPETEVRDESAGLPERLTDEETAMQIHRFLHDMPEPYKEVFTLRVFGELPYERIGLIFGKSAGWARVVYYRAKRLIIDHMEERESGKEDM